MNIFVNSNPLELKGESVTALFEQLAIELNGVAVAVNGKVVPRANHSTFTLKEGDKVVIITATHGG